MQQVDPWNNAYKNCKYLNFSVGIFDTMDKYYDINMKHLKIHCN